MATCLRRAVSVLYTIYHEAQVHANRVIPEDVLVACKDDECDQV